MFYNIKADNEANVLVYLAGLGNGVDSRNKTVAWLCSKYLILILGFGNVIEPATYGDNIHKRRLSWIL